MPSTVTCPSSMASNSADCVLLVARLSSSARKTEKDAQLANELAHAITGGEIPVIYVRGNHEIKGEYAEDLYKYVGSKNQEFCYSVTLGDDDVFAVVLDMGEDHEDDWWEYYGTAQFGRYREAQTRMLEEILENGNYKNYRYRMALCHIPVVYVDKHGYFESTRTEWTSTFIGRLIPAVRQLISIPAGLARMKMSTFLIFTALGAGIWNAILAALGWYLSKVPGIETKQQLIERVTEYSSEIGYFFIALGVFIVGYLIYKAFKK